MFLCIQQIHIVILRVQVGFLVRKHLQVLKRHRKLMSEKLHGKSLIQHICIKLLHQEVKCSHKNTKWETLQEATCTKAGKRVKLCTKCGKSLKTERIKKKNHTLKRYIKKATCTSNGLNWERCSRCNYTHVLNKIPAKGHAFGVTHYGASCTAPEMTIKTCERCGKKETTTKGKPIGHKWGKWQLVSVNASGVRNYRTCVRCGLKQYKNSRYKLKIRGVVNQINWNRILKA